MAIAASSRQFYLGISGEQSGPHSEDEVISKILSGSVPPDTLVWFEGLNDWQPIESLEFFKGAFEQVSQGSYNRKPVEQNEVSENSIQPLAAAISTPVEVPSSGLKRAKPEDLKPVFSEEEAVFFEKKNDKLYWAVGFLALALVSAGVYLFWQSTVEDGPKKASATPAGGKESASVRESKLRQAKDDLLLNSDGAIKILTELARQDANDVAGKEAASVVVDMLKKDFKFGDMGRFLVSIQRFKEGGMALLKDPSGAPEAEQAFYRAYETAALPEEKKEMLQKNIEILFQSLDNVAKGTERVKLFEKDFPGQAHPYKFYLKPDVDQLAELFPRVSFFYVQTLMQFMEVEFPELKLVSRPLVEIKSEKSGKVRFVGTYRGDVILNTDRLKDIRLKFWWIQDQWHLIETNLTPERKRFAKNVQAQLETQTQSVHEALEQVRRLFRAQFPKTPLHESASAKPPTLKE